MRSTDHMPAASWQDSVLDATGARWGFWVVGTLAFVIVCAQVVFS